MHRAGKPAGFRQVPGGGQQNCRMAIVSAGMHAALMGRLVHAVAQLLNRQGVHVGANADSRAVAIAQGADHASTAQTAVHLNAEATQQISHLVRGFQLLKPQPGAAWIVRRQTVASSISVFEIGMYLLQTRAVAKTGGRLGGGFDPDAFHFAVLAQRIQTRRTAITTFTIAAKRRADVIVL